MKTMGYLSLLLLFCGSGCTHWGSHRIYGKKREIHREMLGSPHVAETKTSALSGSVGGSSAKEEDGRRSFLGGVFGKSASVKRRHCVQKTTITYKQPYDVVAVKKGRALDWGGAMALSAMGAAGLFGSYIIGRPSTVFKPGDPFYEPPRDTTVGYVVSGVVVLGGVTWIALSYALLPRKKKPATFHKTRTWKENRFVEAKGCGLIPKERFPLNTSTQASPNIKERLKKLRKLLDDGLITKAEYERKRKKILDEL